MTADSAHVPRCTSSRRARSPPVPSDDARSTSFQMASTVSRSAVVASRSDFPERDDVLFKSRETKGLTEPTAVEGFILAEQPQYPQPARRSITTFYYCRIVGVAPCCSNRDWCLMTLHGAPSAYVLLATASSAFIGLAIRYRKLQEALRRSEQSLGRFLDTLPVIVWRATADGEPDYINWRAASHGRRTLADVVKLKRQGKLEHPADVDLTTREWARARETGKPFDVIHRIRGVDGLYRWYHTRAEPLRDEAGRIINWYGVDVDIDDRKRAEDALRKSEQELRGIVDALPEAIVVIGPDGVGLYVNRPMLDYTGLTREQLMSPDARGNPVLYDPDDWARLRDERLRGLAREMPFEIECRVRRKDGQYRWFLVRYNPLRDEQGRILRWYASGTDIDDRRRAEDALRQSEQELRLLIDTLPAMVWRAAPDGQPDYINQRLARDTGTSLMDLVDLK